MFKYNIYTERKNLRWMCRMISEDFGGFTVYKTLGYWNAKAEKSVVIEIITDHILAERWIQNIRLQILGYNKQDSVLITRQELEVI